MISIGFAVVTSLLYFFAHRKIYSISAVPRLETSRGFTPFNVIPEVLLTHNHLGTAVEKALRFDPVQPVE
jgi:hypothetical protein